MVERIFKGYRLDSELATKLDVEAAKRRSWPNALMEQAIRDWFAVEEVQHFEDLARIRGLTREAAITEAVKAWMERNK